MEQHDPHSGAYHYGVMARAIAEIDGAGGAPLPLEDLARRMGMSAAHFQRVFTRWTGISPKRLQQYLTLGHAKTLLDERFTTLAAADGVGLSGGGRLHDLFVTWEGMSPGEWAGGGDVTVRYGFHDSPFGEGLWCVTERGICGIAFTAETGREAALADMAAPLAGRARWWRILAPPAVHSGRAATFGGGTGANGPHALGARRAVPDQGLGGAAPHPLRPRHDLFGHRRRESATRSAVRAVGTAVGRNPVSVADPLSPGAAQVGRAGRLSLGPAGQARDPRLGGGAGRCRHGRAADAPHRLRFRGRPRGARADAPWKSRAVIA